MFLKSALVSKIYILENSDKIKGNVEKLLFWFPSCPNSLSPHVSNAPVCVKAKQWLYPHVNYLNLSGSSPDDVPIV